jgi:3-methylfumaryl-CoA hydratase
MKETKMSAPTDELRDWIGRSETVHDTVNPTPVVALTATLDHPPADISAGTPLPPLWHWLYFLPMHRQSDIGADGHANRGGRKPIRIPFADPRGRPGGAHVNHR